MNGFISIVKKNLKIEKKISSIGLNVNLNIQKHDHYQHLNKNPNIDAIDTCIIK